MAKKIWYITPTQQFNIDAIRKIRLELDTSAEEISIEVGKNPRYVGHIENPSHNSTHTDQSMSDIANILTNIAKAKQEALKQQKSKKKIKTEYTVLDFYPKKPLPDTRVIKRIDPIPQGSGSAATLNAVLETSDFFDTPRRLKEIVAHCNQLQNQQWEGSDFTQTLSRLVKKGRLQEVPVEGGFVAYVSTEKFKKEKE